MGMCDEKANVVETLSIMDAVIPGNLFDDIALYSNSYSTAGKHH